MKHWVWITMFGVSRSGFIRHSILSILQEIPPLPVLRRKHAGQAAYRWAVPS
jgi:hypothetical protein